MVSGIWFFHCHNEGHLMQGMALLVKIGSAEEFPKPPSNFPKCGGYTYRRSGNQKALVSKASLLQNKAIPQLCIFVALTLLLTSFIEESLKL